MSGQCGHAWGRTGRGHRLGPAPDHRSAAVAAPLVPRPNAANPPLALLPPGVIHQERSQLWPLGWRGRQRGERRLGMLAHPTQSDACMCKWAAAAVVGLGGDAKVCRHGWACGPSSAFKLPTLSPTPLHGWLPQYVSVGDSWSDVSLIKLDANGEPGRSRMWLHLYSGAHARWEV